MIIFEKTKNVKTPERANPTDSGIDFYIPNDFQSTTVGTGARLKIDLGIKVNIKEGFDLQFVGKSGLASNEGIGILGGLIDNGYRGELSVIIINLKNEPIFIHSGQKIVQGVIRKVETFPLVEGEVNNKTDRGEGGFGSSGLGNEKEWEEL